MQTYTFILPSGIEAEVKYISGEASEVFTKKKNIETGMAHTLLIKQVLVRVGDETNITIEFIERLLTKDRKAILFTARQFTYDFPEEYKIITKFGKSEVEYPISLEDYVPSNYPFYQKIVDEKKKLSEENEFKYEPEPAFKSYEEVLEKRKCEVLLPKSKKTVYFYLMTGKDEKRALKVNSDEASLLTVMSLRNPVEMGQKGEIMLNLRELHAMDLGALNGEMDEAEDDFQTVIEINDPNKFGESKIVNIMDHHFFFGYRRSSK
ncbi:MAG: hypothetical protein MUC49_15585 [Raineya sp.]|jgi:hypothetical protein|nr:hypothetical protein [Raineya sp.]